MKENNLTHFIMNMARQKEIDITTTSDLFESGVLDSLNMVNLLIWLEEELNIKIPFDELNLQNFKNIENIQRLIDLSARR